MFPEAEGPRLADRLVVFGALAFLIGTAAATYLYAIDPYPLTTSLFQVPPGTSWPFYLGSVGLVSLSAGGLLARVRRS